MTDGILQYAREEGSYEAKHKNKSDNNGESEKKAAVAAGGGVCS
jgi:hypothetical protein